MEEIEKLYNEYVVSGDTYKKIRNQLLLILNIELVFKSIERHERQLARKVRKNNLVERFFPERKGVLDAENSIYFEMMELMDENLDYFIAITREIDSENYKELTKLVDFLITHFVGNLLYYEAQIEGIYQALKGVNFIDNSKQNTREGIKAFVGKKVEEIKVQKQLAKKYEM